MNPGDLKILKSKIDNEISEIKNNVNRGIKGLTELMIELFLAQWDANNIYITWKTRYEEMLSDKKKEKEIELSKKEGYKITDSELERYAKALLLKEYKAYRDAEAEYEQLTSYINGYVNHVNGIKFDTKEGNRLTQSFSNV